MDCLSDRGKVVDGDAREHSLRRVASRPGVLGSPRRWRTSWFGASRNGVLAVETAVDTEELGDRSYRADLFVKPERDPADPEDPLIWSGEANPPMRFTVHVRSLPELVGTAERYARELPAIGPLELHVCLIPDKVPPEPIVELHLEGLGG